MAFKKGNTPWMKGKKVSPEIKKKISTSLKGNVPWNKGKIGLQKHSEETKKRISAKLKNNIPWHAGKKIGSRSLIAKRHISEGLMGRKLSIESRNKISNTLINKNLRGENCIHWKGGITPLNHAVRCMIENSEWRSKVFERDNWTCQTCRARGSITLHAHHIKSFDNIMKENNISSTEEARYCAELWSVNNGVTLCTECHKDIHRLNKETITI